MGYLILWWPGAAAAAVRSARLLGPQPLAEAQPRAAAGVQQEVPGAAPRAQGVQPGAVPQSARAEADAGLQRLPPPGQRHPQEHHPEGDEDSPWSGGGEYCGQRSICDRRPPGAASNWGWSKGPRVWIQFNREQVKRKNEIKIWPQKTQLQIKTTEAETKLSLGISAKCGEVTLPVRSSPTKAGCQDPGLLTKPKLLFVVSTSSI